MKTIAELFTQFPILKINDKITLRQFQLSDAKRYLEFYSIPEVNQFIPDSMIPQDIEQSKTEIQTILNSFNTKSTFYWAIVNENNELIGGCGFHDWNRYNARIEIAYDLHPDYHRKGIMFECVKAIVKFAFMNMYIIRITATTVQENDASNNLLLKFGFKYEGLLRKYKFFKNKMIDVMMFSYTIDDFNKSISLGKL